METMTVSGFRKNMAAAFNKAASGEHVMVRRGSQIFAIVPVDDKELTITPELQTKLDVARDEYNKGVTMHFDKKEEMHDWLKSL